jgi:hypothetical protein
VCWNIFEPLGSRQSRQLGAVGRNGFGLSLILLIVTAICIWPPERILSDLGVFSFYATIAAFCLVVRAGPRFARRWLSRTFVILVVIAVIVGNFSDGVPTGIAFGVFFFFFLAINLFCLFPNWAGQLIATNAAASRDGASKLAG